ncbi:MAG: hypothetical protein ACT4PL_04070 [Phycisphaerales bacterium]
MLLTRRSLPPAHIAAMGLVLAAGSACCAGDNPVILEYFETSWDNIETRTPDVFMAGYGGMWLPSPCMASTGSAGYDPFDRFNLGQPGAETAFGTEAKFRQLVKELHLAGVLVYPEGIFNHNGARTSNADFIADGGWPGFYVPGNGPSNNPPGPAFLSGSGPWVNCGDFVTRAGANYFWGDFHNGATQSENPGSGNYCLWLGDLVSLVDIAQESNYSCIRHPTSINPLNIPPGRIRNLPNPDNARFYPDRNLAPRTFTNPGIAGFSTTTNWTVYPFNTAAPLAGDPQAESATGLLQRWAQWMIEEIGVDGFRLDAAKHTKHDFWNERFDAAVYQTRVTPGGQRVTPFSFGETVDSNSAIQFYIRKDSFGNRDALDLNEAGGLRDVLNAGGFGRWAKDSGSDPEGPIERSVDTNDDGQNNGSQGVHHVFSHDNGSVGSGGTNPPLPTLRQQGLPQNAYVLSRTGLPIVYYNGREMASRFASRGFWPREGNPSALGNNNTIITDLVRIHNGHARSNMNIINSTDGVNPSKADVLAIERSNNTAANLLSLVNDSYSNGFQFRSLDTSFPGGSRLMELTGAWNDTGASGANLGGSISRIITLDGNGRALFPIPNNRNTSGVEHNRGFVVYGLPAPAGAVAVTPVASVIPADTVAVSEWKRRLTPVDVVTSPSFEIRLTTTKADVGDPGQGGNPNFNTDDFAVFRLNEGFRDYNGINPNGTPTGYDQPLASPLDAGYERFVTQNSPLFNSPGASEGLYRQTINAALLPEGFNYLTVVAYRHREDGGAAISSEFRKVFYVDLLPPQVALVLPEDNIINTAGFSFRVLASDRCTNTVYIIANAPEGVDPRTQPATYLTAANQATRHDRFEFRRAISNLPAGTNSITVVAFELSGNSVVTRYDGIVNSLGSGDVNRDGVVNIDDLHASWQLGSTYQGEADMDRDGDLDTTDRRLLEALIRATENAAMEGSQR